MMIMAHCHGYIKTGCISSPLLLASSSSLMFDSQSMNAIFSYTQTYINPFNCNRVHLLWPSYVPYAAAPSISGSFPQDPCTTPASTR